MVTTNKKTIKLTLITIVLILLIMPLYLAVTVVIKKEWSPAEQIKINEKNLAYIGLNIVQIKEQIIILSLKKDKAQELNYSELYNNYNANINELNTELTILEQEVNKKC